MAKNKLADLSMDFAVNILKMTDDIKGHYSLINQLERSATSIGVNIGAFISDGGNLTFNNCSTYVNKISS